MCVFTFKKKTTGEFGQPLVWRSAASLILFSDSADSADKKQDHGQTGVVP